MTEAEWLASTKLNPMLDYLQGKASDRKWMLFSCACVRRIWRLVTDARCRSYVEVAERFADGLASGEELNRAAEVIEVADDLEDEAGNHTFQAVESVGYTGALAAQTAAAKASDSASFAAANASGEWSAEAWNAAEAAEHRTQMVLLRDLFGNPFRPPPAIDPAVLAWNGGTVRRLAQCIYEERQMPEGALDNARLGVLADALRDAGCDSEEILAHCRSEGPHVRGCWVVDCVLGRA
jgi:hypothetical protein